MKKTFLLGLLLALLFSCVSTDSGSKATKPEPTKTPAPKKVVITRRAIPGYVARKAGAVPVIDGVVTEGEWKDGIIYPFGLNQLNLIDQRPPQDLNNLCADWTVVYDGKTLYGMVTRKDDVTYTKAGEVYDNDCIEVFLQQKGKFAQFRTVVGEDFAPIEYGGAQLAVWNAEGTVLEFSIQTPEENLDGLACGFLIALADNDGSGRKTQLYPIAGQNDAWQQKNLGTLIFGQASAAAEPARWVPTFKAKPNSKDIVVDGNYSDEEWSRAVKYPLLYNQLKSGDQTFNKDYNDLYGDWAIVHKDNMVYGFVRRTDDITVTNAENAYDNDCVELFFEVEGRFAQIRTVVGQKFDSGTFNGTAVWSADGTVLEFSFDFGKPAVELGVIGFNIALSDNDGDGREYQLYPIFGYNDSWQGKNLAELEFSK